MESGNEGMGALLTAGTAGETLQVGIPTRASGSAGAPLSSLGVQKIAPAYRQVADQIRGLILDGSLSAGERLPAEEKLAATFGVSRNTVRESLKMLVSQNLVETTRGVAGGSFVTTPNAEALQAQFETSLGLMSGIDAVNRDELLEARASIEIPSSRWAAERRSETDLGRIRRAAHAVEHGGTALVRADFSQDFHQAVVDAAGNRLLSMIAPPIWRVFKRASLQAGGARDTWNDIDEDHLQILAYIEEKRPEEAAEAMRLHLLRLHAHDL